MTSTDTGLPVGEAAVSLNQVVMMMVTPRDILKTLDCILAVFLFNFFYYFYLCFICY